jgi:hypothetical protein
LIPQAIVFAKGIVGLFPSKYTRSVLELGVERTMKHGSGEVA